MQNQEYREISAYNNSFLSNVKNWLMGKPLIEETQAMRFGSALHEWELEPEKFRFENHRTLTTDEWTKMHKMKETLEQSAIWGSLWHNSVLEQVETFELLGMPCKGIVDMIRPDRRTIVDLKTTSCFTQAAFEEAIMKYEYQRQAAFYLDGTGAKNFVFAAISKTKTEKIFWFEFHRDSELIQKGRKMYEFLLRKCKEYQIPPNCELSSLGTPEQRLTEIGALAKT